LSDEQKIVIETLLQDVIALEATIEQEEKADQTAHAA
jgi:hypothetical protein